MNHLVPDFEMDDDYSIPSSSGLTRLKKSPMAEEEIMELLWQNGQVVMQSQNQRSLRRSHVGEGVNQPEHTAAAAKEIRTEEESATQLFIQEDEMASWLHYPIDDSFDRDFYADLIYPAPTAPVAPIPDDVRISTPPAAATAAAPRPPIPPPARRPEVESPARRPEVESPARTQNFLHFSRPKKGRTEAGPSICNKAARDSTVVDSSETLAPGSTVSHAAAQVSGGNVRYGAAASGAAAVAVAVASPAAGEETGLASSPGCSGASVSASAEPVHKPVLAAVTEDRKRKGIEADDGECQSEVFVSSIVRRFSCVV